MKIQLEIPWPPPMNTDSEHLLWNFSCCGLDSSLNNNEMLIGVQASSNRGLRYDFSLRSIFTRTIMSIIFDLQILHTEAQYYGARHNML